MLNPFINWHSHSGKLAMYLHSRDMGHLSVDKRIHMPKQGHPLVHEPAAVVSERISGLLQQSYEVHLIKLVDIHAGQRLVGRLVLAALHLKVRIALQSPRPVSNAHVATALLHLRVHAGAQSG